jgi:23S rRNA (pseudouridine1915-N3)-methyltransferase
LAREWWVVWAGRHRRDSWDELCDDYRTRIDRHVVTREVVVRSRVAGGAERLAAEGSAILAALPSPCRLVVLDRDAKPTSSEELARRLETWRDEWSHPVVFAVGSDLGLANDVSKRSDWRLSFGPITLPHELARLVLWEQLYRAVAISCGSSYHRKSVGSLL